MQTVSILAFPTMIVFGNMVSVQRQLTGVSRVLSVDHSPHVIEDGQFPVVAIDIEDARASVSTPCVASAMNLQ
jgi:predicted small integral membrane protein